MLEPSIVASVLAIETDLIELRALAVTLDALGEALEPGPLPGALINLTGYVRAALARIDVSCLAIAGTARLAAAQLAVDAAAELPPPPDA